MRAHEAAEQVRRTVFKPGWRFFASVMSPDVVNIRARIETVDTSYPDADGQCRKPLTLSGTEADINVSHMDEQGLCYELIKLAQQVNLHEDREFLKVRKPDGSWVAPLHPHTYTGELGWQQLGGSRSATPDDDLSPLDLLVLEMMEGAR